jgi:hypothetical protein
VAKPESMYDFLCSGLILRRQLNVVTPSDIHLFSYLACLLAVYNGIPASDWGYRFVGTELGSPFSVDLDSASSHGILAGMVTRNEDTGFLEFGHLAEEEVTVLETLDSCGWHKYYIEAAVSSLLSLPPGLVKSAVSQEPNLRPVTRMRSPRKLLEGAGLDLLYEQFESLNSVLHFKAQDLIVPATVWLTFLARKALKTGEQSIE